MNKYLHICVAILTVAMMHENSNAQGQENNSRIPIATDYFDVNVKDVLIGFVDNVGEFKKMEVIGLGIAVEGSLIPQMHGRCTVRPPSFPKHLIVNGWVCRPATGHSLECAIRGPRGQVCVKP